ncbi:hypothetical protein B0I37DRAFT_431117 [Chaetomium sp. MPI-CAGE-AT-0009]|nr:hypothetical protein B0I37DRAFT_431117 [Chaetomium sp. MPI-CAGE-AT-0009]
MAIADGALFGISSLDDLWQQRMVNGDNEMPLLWNDSASNLPIAFMMVHHTTCATTLFAGLTVAQSYPPDVVDKLATDSLPKLKEWLAKNPQDGCTFETAVRRREWSLSPPQHQSDLSPEERKDYTDTVLYLQSKPALTGAAAPGAKSRYKGYQPYWNWDRYTKDPVNSPLFDGGEASMGGNGAKESHEGITLPGTGIIPPADGGACVTEGPFKNPPRDIADDSNPEVDAEGEADPAYHLALLSNPAESHKLSTDLYDGLKDLEADLREFAASVGFCIVSVTGHALALK